GRARRELSTGPRPGGGRASGRQHGPRWADQLPRLRAAGRRGARAGRRRPAAGSGAEIATGALEPFYEARPTIAGWLSEATAALQLKGREAFLLHAMLTSNLFNWWERRALLPGSGRPHLGLRQLIDRVITRPARLHGRRGPRSPAATDPSRRPSPGAPRPRLAAPAAVRPPRILRCAFLTPSPGARRRRRCSRPVRLIALLRRDSSPRSRACRSQ